MSLVSGYAHLCINQTFEKSGPGVNNKIFVYKLFEEFASIACVVKWIKE